MKRKRRILFITERRADYSRLKPIMKAAKESKELEPLLLVTGAHLLRNFGETRRIISSDGFHIDAILPISHENDPDTGIAMGSSFGKAIIGMTTIIPRLKPDIIIAGFDLGANLAAAIVGMHLNIHVAHIGGGEVSGTIDEVIRHAITKFAHIHFPTTEESRRRIIRLGEDPRYVFVVGSPGLDTLRSIEYPSKATMFKKFNLDLKKRLIIFLQHPVTTEEQEIEKHITQSITAVKEAMNIYGAQAIAIYPNTDTGGKRIIVQLKKSKITILPHIPYEDFLRLMNVADVLVGNSSAGIQEAPSFGLPTINIGTRQQLRERGKNVIDVGYHKKNIIAAIKKSFFDKKFISKVKKAKNPYENKDSAKKIVHVLETINLPPIQKIICH